VKQSPASVVLRGRANACICGGEAVKIDAKNQQFSVNETIVEHGDTSTIDGAVGDIMLGNVPMIEPELSAEFQRLLSWADEEKKMTVRTNADDPLDASKAFEYEAYGIRLCR